MVQFTLFLVAVFLALLVDSTAFGVRKCSMEMKGVIVDPKTGCCGKHAGDEFPDTGFTWTLYNRNRRTRSADNNNASHIAPDKYIFGGKSAGIAQYPWLAFITVTYEKKAEGNESLGFYTILCGGTLVSSRHVITAAHCVNVSVKSFEDINIVLADYNTETYPEDCVGSACVMNLRLHPDRRYVHKDYSFEGVLKHDIAMLRLSGTPPFTDYIRPICLPYFNINHGSFEGTRLSITGWGQTENGHGSVVKMQSVVHMVAPNICKRDYPYITEENLCAAGKEGQDICSGDSGGPIMLERGGTFYIVGVASAKRSGDECGSPVPSKYTNVFSYMQWIQDIIKYNE